MTTNDEQPRKRKVKTSPLPNDLIEFSTEPGVELWDKQPGECDTWYNRFLLYLGIEGMRTVTMADKLEKINKNDGNPLKKSTAPHQSWFKAHKVLRWEERCAAYDKRRFEEVEARKAEWRLKLADLQHESAQLLLQKSVEILPQVKSGRLDAIVQAINTAFTLMRQSADEFDGTLDQAITKIRNHGFLIIDPQVQEQDSENNENN